MHQNRTALSRVVIVPRIPDHRGHEYGDPVPPNLEGATIVRFGTVDREVARRSETRLEGGGLLLDYIPLHGSSLYRVALSFGTTETTSRDSGGSTRQALPVDHPDNASDTAKSRVILA